MGIMNVPVHLRTVLPWVWLQNTKDKFNWYGYIVVQFILFSKTKFISSASKILKKKKKDVLRVGSIHFCNRYTAQKIWMTFGWMHQIEI